MQRIFDATAAGSLPAVPTLSGSAGYFSEGVPGVTAATKLRAWWANMVQEELMSLLSAGGITPDTSGTNFTQVLAALRALFGGTPGSLATNGYMKLAGGLILQQGQATTNNGVAVSFPYAFPTACFVVLASEAAAASGTWGAGYPTAHAGVVVSASQFTHYSLTWNGSSWVSASNTCSYIALGH